jgi:hypothetical protein
MGIFDFLQGSQGAPAPQAAPAPQPAAAQPTPSPQYADFINNLIAAAAAGAKAHPTSLWNALSGAGTDAAKAEATANAPALWDAFKQAQAGSQGAQLNNTANLAAQGAMADTDIDPNNIAASKAAIQHSLSGAFAPIGGGAPSGDPLAQQRSFYDRMGMMYSRMPGGASVAKEFFALRDKGAPENTTVLGRTGQVADGVSGLPVAGDVGAVKAAQATPTKRMETGFDMAKANHQAGLDVSVHSRNADTDSAHKLNFGLDKTTGQPTVKTDAELLGGEKNNFADKNPYFEGQQSESSKICARRARAPTKGLNLGTQISQRRQRRASPARAPTALQDVRKLALTAGQLAGVEG